MTPPAAPATKGLELLACPRCHAALDVSGEDLLCRASCGFTGSLSDGVFVVADRDDVSFFDATNEVMEHGSTKPGVQRLCYTQQADFLESALNAGTTVLDVGCGPKIPYRRTQPYTLIGLDPSYESIKRNTDVDVRVFGFAGRLPLADSSIDTVLALYAVHHFGGQNRAENRQRVSAAFSEFARVLKPGGRLFVFELEPWWLAWQAQVAAWDLIRKLFPGMDIFFWRAQALREVVAPALPSGTSGKMRMFKSPLFDTFAPAFAFPKLQIPRFMFPFRIRLYDWETGAKEQ